ncbi:MAG: NIPSNAP family protein [Ferruginibacter sp.]
MKNNHIKLVCLLLLTLPLFSSAQKNKSGEFYQIILYHFSNADQQKIIDGYLKDAYLPALHRQQIKSIGVFTPISNDTAADKRLYVLFPVKSLQQVTDLNTRLDADNEYLTNGKEYLDIAFDKPAYSRKEIILLKAFPLAPFMSLPALKRPAAERVYELRSYESASENIFHNKVQMFNEGGEISLFKRLNFNAVFYASVIAGSHMPNLMYMTSFENMADRDAHWKTFSSDPEWKTLSAKPEYKNNVQKNDTNLMRATSYSDY